MSHYVLVRCDSESDAKAIALGLLLQLNDGAGVPWHIGDGPHTVYNIENAAEDTSKIVLVMQTRRGYRDVS